jgi:uncharacterized membrane protein YkoI
MRKQVLTLVVCLAAVLATAAQADSRGHDGDLHRDGGQREAHDRDRDREPQQASGISLDEAVARAEKQYGARAVRAERVREGDRTVYRIRLLAPDGRVFNVTVDAGDSR